MEDCFKLSLESDVYVGLTSGEHHCSFIHIF